MPCSKSTRASVTASAPCPFACGRATRRSSENRGAATRALHQREVDMRFSSDRRLSRFAAPVGVFVVGVIVLFQNVGAPFAQEPYVHVNPVIAKLSRGEHVFGVPVTDLSLVNARALAREPLIDYIT